MDLPWVFEETTNLILHEDHLCRTCHAFKSHYHETGTLPNNASFRDACRTNQDDARLSMSSTVYGLDMLGEGLEAMAKDLNQEITEATRELEEMRQKMGQVSREMEKLSQELKEVVETGLEEARPAQHVPDSDSDVEIISPPRQNTRTRTPRARSVSDPDSVVEIFSTPF